MIAPIMREHSYDKIHFGPCGGTQAGPVHFEANPGSKNVIGWTVIERAEQGTCRMKIGADPDGINMQILYPLDESADDTGSFPCGRDETPFEGKMVRFPKNLDCDTCLFMFEWKTPQGVQYMCGDVGVRTSTALECEGQCLNGGVCNNGVCHCSKHF